MKITSIQQNPLNLKLNTPKNISFKGNYASDPQNTTKFERKIPLVNTEAAISNGTSFLKSLQKFFKSLGKESNEVFTDTDLMSRVYMI